MRISKNLELQTEILQLSTRHSFLEAVYQEDGPSPRLAKEFALLEIDTPRFRILCQELFNILTLEELNVLAQGECRMSYIDTLIVSNINYISDHMVAIYSSIKEGGLTEPIVCLSLPEPNLKLRVWDGSLRVQCCKLLGYTRLPVYVYPHNTRLTKGANPNGV